jgi:hypothetical protein
MGSHGSSGPGAGRLLYIKHTKVLQRSVQYGSALSTRYLPERKFKEQVEHTITSGQSGTVPTVMHIDS